jgi:hypothetical protein
MMPPTCLGSPAERAGLLACCLIRMRRRCWASAALLHGLDKAMCARCWRVWLNGLARDVNLPKLAALQAQLRSSALVTAMVISPADLRTRTAVSGALSGWRTPPGHATAATCC